VKTRVHVVTASINELVNISRFKPMLTKHECKVIVVDEGDREVRRRNDKRLTGLSYAFYGPKEREEWFKERFSSGYKRFLSVIPKRCHAETSFGFLVAYEEDPDFVVELDDDVFPMRGHNLVTQHANNLFEGNGVTVHSKEKWYNTINNLELNLNAQIFPRGHPYSEKTRAEKYTWSKIGGDAILNVGLWAGNLDLDALTILRHGGLDGGCDIEGEKCKRRKVIVGQGTYLAVCSMNAAFSPKIIPAFYQLYMNYMGVDRFDDIWSGIFLKKIADKLGDGICLGEPLVYHDKRPRDVFKDLRKELEGMVINELLWKLVDEIRLDGGTYWDCYNSLVHELEKPIANLQYNMHRKFMRAQLEKMKIWLRIIDRLK